MSRRYSLFGLTVHSEVELPDLSPATDEALAAIRIRTVEFGPELPRSPGLHWLGDKDALLCIEDVGRYRCTDGRELLVEACPGVPDRNVRLFLLGSAMGLLLHQRGLLPLHANAVDVDGAAIAFLGQSGAGKSTLAAWFAENGHRVIADDVCVVQFDTSGRALACPGLPRLRLWRDALERSGQAAHDYERSYAGDPEYDKFDVPVGQVSGPVPLGAIYLLDRGSPAITPLHGVAAIEALFANTYRGAFVATTGDPQTHWSDCLRIARTVPLFRWTRTWGVRQLGAESERVLAHARSLPELPAMRSASSRT